MTNIEKQLLLKELCARLLYDVKVQTSLFESPTSIKGITEDECWVYFDEDNYEWVDIEEVKPYLRPISSLTDEECNTLFKILDINEKDGDWLKINDINVIRLFTENGKDFYEIADAMDYLYSIHIDFRDMIEKGLALEALEGMYKIE